MERDSRDVNVVVGRVGEPDDGEFLEIRVASWNNGPIKIALLQVGLDDDGEVKWVTNKIGRLDATAAKEVSEYLVDAAEIASKFEGEGGLDKFKKYAAKQWLKEEGDVMTVAGDSQEPVPAKAVTVAKPKVRAKKAK